MPFNPQLLFVVGTRPETIKMAPLIRAACSRGVPFELVHTGQHYDDVLDGVFFRELELPAPDLRLGCGSAGREEQISRVRQRLGESFEQQRPRVVVVQGDTNSVLGATLAAGDAGLPVAHVEAGLRCGDLEMPEEQNRREVDRLASILFAPTKLARDQLLADGLPNERIFITGNTVVDELARCLPLAMRSGALERFGLVPGGFGVATLHRQEALRDSVILRELLGGLAAAADEAGLPIVLPLHPRTRARLDDLGLAPPPSIRPLPPLGYLDFLCILANARVAWTDSGGVQEEACVLGVPSVVLRDSTERPEAVQVGASHLGGRAAASILEASRRALDSPRLWTHPFGDGEAGSRCVALMERHLLTP